MGDVQRNLCQLLLSQGCFLEDDLVERYHECLDRHKRQKRWHKDDDEKNRKELGRMIDELNEQLEALGIKVARMKSKATGKWEMHYGVVNLLGDDAFSSLALGLTKAEQELFHKVISEIIASEERKIESTDAASLRHQLTASKINQADAEACLERLASGSWLATDDNGNYLLGVRTELQQRYMATTSEPAAEGASAAVAELE